MIMRGMLPEDLGPYVALMLAGFACGILGHIFHLRWMIAVGILMIFTATLLVPVALNLFGDQPEPPGPNVPQPV